MNLIKFHRDLVKYVIVGWKNNKTIKAKTLFFLNLGKELYKVWFNEYRRLFWNLSPLYRKQKADFKKKQEAMKNLQNAIKVLRYALNKQTQGMNRTDKRVFLRDFYDGKISQKLLDNIMKETGF